MRPLSLVGFVSMINSVGAAREMNWCDFPQVCRETDADTLIQITNHA